MISKEKMLLALGRDIRISIAFFRLECTRHVLRRQRVALLFRKRLAKLRKCMLAAVAGATRTATRVNTTSTIGCTNAESKINPNTYTRSESVLIPPPAITSAFKVLPIIRQQPNGGDAEAANALDIPTQYLTCGLQRWPIDVRLV
jgi:hypothetical protein